MEDEKVREENPFRSRHDPHQVLLHIHRVPGARQSQPARHPVHVGVHHDSVRDSVAHAQDHVRGLPRHSRKREQVLHPRWDLPLVRLHDAARGAAERAGLVVEEAGGADQLLHLLHAGIPERRGIGKAREESRRHLVHPLVRALRGEDGRDEELERIVVTERAGRVGIRGPEALDQRLNARVS